MLLLEIDAIFNFFGNNFNLCNTLYWLEESPVTQWVIIFHILHITIQVFVIWEGLLLREGEGEEKKMDGEWD